MPVPLFPWSPGEGPGFRRAFYNGSSTNGDASSAASQSSYFGYQATISRQGSRHAEKQGLAALSSNLLRYGWIQSFAGAAIGFAVANRFGFFWGAG